MLGLSELKILVKRAFDRGFIDRRCTGFEHFERDSNGRSSDPANRDIHKIKYSHCLAKPLRSYPAGTVSVTTTALLVSGIFKRPKLNLPKANPTEIRSEGLADTTLVLAAAARSSRIAAWVDDAALRKMSDENAAHCSGVRPRHHGRQRRSR